MPTLMVPWMFSSILTAAASGYGVRCADANCASCELNPIQRVQHSSALTPATRYGAQMAFDGDKATAWCEGVPGSGEGHGLTITLNEPRVIEAIFIHGGYFKSADLLAANGRAKRIQMTISNAQSGQSFTTPLQLDDPVEVPPMDPCTREAPTSPAAWFDAARDGNGAYVFANHDEGPHSIPVDTIQLTLSEVYKGSRYPDTCISEIEILVRESAP